MKRLFACLVSLFVGASVVAQTTGSSCVTCIGTAYPLDTRCFLDQGAWSTFEGQWTWPNGKKYCRPKLPLSAFCPGSPNSAFPQLNSMCANQYCCAMQTIVAEFCACVSSSVVWNSDGIHDGPWVPCSVVDACGSAFKSKIDKAQADYIECFSNNPDPKTNINDHGSEYCGHSFTYLNQTFCSDPMCNLDFPICDLSGWILPCSNNLKNAYYNLRTAAINDYYACLRNASKKAVFRFSNGPLPPNNEIWDEPDNSWCGTFDGTYDPNENPYWGLYYDCGQAQGCKNTLLSTLDNLCTTYTNSLIQSCPCYAYSDPFSMFPPKPVNPSCPYGYYVDYVNCLNTVISNYITTYQNVHNCTTIKDANAALEAAVNACYDEYVRRCGEV